MKSRHWIKSTCAAALAGLILVAATATARADDEGGHEGRWHAREGHDHHRDPDRADPRRWGRDPEYRNPIHWDHEHHEHHEHHERHEDDEGAQNRAWWWPVAAVWLLRSGTPVIEPAPPPPTPRYAYYCGPAGAYYPTVLACPGGWQAVSER